MATYTIAQQRTITAALNLISERIATGSDYLTSPSRTFDFLRLYFAGLDLEREHFVVLFLDSQHGVIETERLFSGTIDGAAVYPREIAKAALRRNAAAVILAHNHPSGLAEPSSADKRITDRIKAAMGLLDIRVLDHIIVGDGCYSFAERGVL